MSDVTIKDASATSYALEPPRNPIQEIHVFMLSYNTKDGAIEKMNKCKADAEKDRGK